MSETQESKPLSAEEEAFFSCLNEDPTTLQGQQSGSAAQVDGQQPGLSNHFFANEAQLSTENSKPQADLSAEPSGQGRMLLLVAVLALLAVAVYVAVL